MASSGISISIVGLTVQYQRAVLPTLEALSMTIAENQWTCLLGRSGSGKTTILRYLAGLLDDSAQCSGHIDANVKQPLEELTCYMAQQDLLLPWLSVLDNVCLSDRLSGRTITEDTVRKAKGLLQQVGLLDTMHSLPQYLSGGMRQRAALARTLMQDKPLVLMDEPFSALDAVTRHKLQTLSHELLRNKTVVHITHDPHEAVRLSDKLYVLTGTPARARSLSLPEGLPPRDFSVEHAELQQQILQVLEQDSV